MARKSLKRKLLDFLGEIYAALAWVHGKKTYIIAGIGAVISALQGYGIDIPGFTGEDWGDILIYSAGIAALRHGNKKGTA